MREKVWTDTKLVSQKRQIVKNLIWATVNKLSDYLQLIKFKLSSLVVITIALGYLIALKKSWLNVGGHFALTLLGSFLIVAAANAFNQILERDVDALMKRTKNRPLPAGRMSVSEATSYATLMAVFGLTILALSTNWKTTTLAVTALAIYVLVYTPLKRKSEFCILIGSISGAIPPAMGWVAARNELSHEAVALFAFQFLWQFPHFWAIAWMYRDDYLKVGFRILPINGNQNSVTRKTVYFTIATVIGSAYPLLAGKASMAYAFGVILMGLWFIKAAMHFYFCQTRQSAKNLLCVADSYLPLVLILWLWTSQNGR